MAMARTSTNGLDAVVGTPLPAESHPCPYLANRQASFEQFHVHHLGRDAFRELVMRGYRHFGDWFFRPRCCSCGACIPIRVSSTRFRRSRSVRRLFKRNRDLRVDLCRPSPSEAAYALYLSHKRKFESSSAPESYASFRRSLFAPFPFSHVLEIREGEHLICVAHLDVCQDILSAIYCYYDLAHSQRAPGRFAILLEIEIARRLGIPFVYLGYYIRDNPHMRYKADYTPNQVSLDEGNWVDFMTSGPESSLPARDLMRGFSPQTAVFHGLS